MKRTLRMSAAATVLIGVAGIPFLVYPAPAPVTKETPMDEEVPNRSGQVVPAVDAGDSPKANDSPKAKDSAKGNASTRVEESPKGKDDAKPGGVRKSIEERRLLLPTVATLASAQCYQTYLNLGLIADGREKNTYSEKDARKLLDSVLSTLNSVDRSLGSLDKLDLDGDERDHLEQVRAAWALLRQQGNQLHVVWDGGKDRDEELRNYESLRRNSWATITKIMGLAR